MIDRHVAAAQAVAALQDKLALSRTEDDVSRIGPAELARDAEFTQLAKAATDWLKVRAAQVAEVNRRDIAAKVKRHLAARWAAGDAAVKEAKARLDAALSGPDPVAAGTLNPLLKPLDNAGTPSRDADWRKGRDATLKVLANREAPFDDMARWAEELFLKERDEVSGGNWQAGLKQANEKVLGELKKRMKQLVADVGASFTELNAPSRQAAADALNKIIDAMKSVGDAGAARADIRYRAAWDFEDRLEAQLKAQLKAQLNATTLARRPTRKSWAEHLGIPENHDRRVPTPATFELEGVVHRSHFTVSYDSVTAARPLVYGVPVASVRQAAFVSGVPTVFQGHATIEFQPAANNPHLFLSGELHPKLPTGQDQVRARQVLQLVHARMLAWLDPQIASFQQTLQ